MYTSPLVANGVGTGAADDKAVYAYVPRMIKYYLDQDAILPNVETHICRDHDGLRYTLDHLPELVVKPVAEAGGYGITVCPRASADDLDACRRQLVADQLHQPAAGALVGVSDAGGERNRAAAC